MISRTVFLLAAFSLPSAVISEVWFNPTVTCDSIPGRYGTSFEVCGVSAGSGPSPVDLEDGTTIYLGGFSTTFMITKDVEEGSHLGLLESNLGIEVEVQRDDDDSSSVTVTTPKSTEKCTSSSYCGNDKYSADCTNLKHGREVKCESAAPMDVFFPMNAWAVSKYSGFSLLL